MLNFKEYTLMSFQNLFEERFKNHFLKEARQNLFKFNFSAGFLSSLTEDGNNSEAIKYFVNLIDTKKIYADLFNSFLSDSSNKNYYRFACYYMKENNLPSGISPLNSDFTKGKSADIALKEIFANELYKHLIILSKREKNKQKTSFDDIIADIKKNITKTFVIDSRVKQEARQPNDYHLYTYFGRSETRNFGDSDGFQDNLGLKKRDLLFNGIDFDTLTASPLFTLDKEGLLYNNVALSFQNRIFNQVRYNENLEQAKQAPNGTLRLIEEINSAYSSTTKETKYTDLLEKNGAYVEFYFKFDNVFREGTKVQAFGVNQPISLLYSNEDKNNLPQDVNYYSFRETLAYCLYLKSAMTPINSSKPAYTSPTDLSPHINFKLGARLVINAPNFESFISNEIVSKNNFYSTNYNEEVSGPFSGFETPKQLEPNIYKLVADYNSYAKNNNNKSAAKNKTFVCNFIDQEQGDARVVDGAKNAYLAPVFITWLQNFYSITKTNSIVLGEYNIGLSEDETKNILEKIKGADAKLNYIDFIIDNEIISKYYEQVLNELFKIQIVNEYFLSKTNSLEAISAVSLENDEIYNEATKGTILSSGSIPEEFINEANKMDDIIDQNLITLINSIEVS